MFKAALPVSSALTPFRPLAASQMPPANVMLDTREQMEASALRAVSTNTKKSWGRLIALGVIRTLPLWLAVLCKPTVDATPDTWVQMEPHARNAAPVLISQD